MTSQEAKEASHTKTKSSSDTGTDATNTSAKSLESVLALFKAGDDTSNFVAISLLRSLLHERKELREDQAVTTKCWNSIPSKFLGRLLKAKTSEKRTKDEAQSMVSLAVAIIHTFVNLLPREVVDDPSFQSHADQLVAVVPSSSPSTVSQISQILLALNFPSLLFDNSPKTNGLASNTSPYLFIKMLLIDTRSTIPSLQEKLNTPEYPKTSLRIAESFDVISNFIGYLISSLDEDSDDENDSECPKSNSKLQLEPSQLLQLRTDISETMSLTIEHLRDRYDSSVAGAAGLHPSARIDTDLSSSAPRTITWQSSTTSMSEDPLTLSEIRALALWLREDDNDALRKEAAGVMDLLLALFSEIQPGLEFCSPVLIALEGILEVPEGIEAFLGEEGWNTLISKLGQDLNSDEIKAAEQGVEIVRVLLKVVESDVTGPTKEDWMTIVRMAVGALQDSKPPTDKQLDLHIAVSQLAVELLSQAPKNMKKRYRAEALKLSKAASARLGIASGESEVGLLEIVEGLDGLGF